VTHGAAADFTNDPARSSWVATANGPDADFPIQNLPFASFKPRDSATEFRGGVAIGDQIVDLAALTATGMLSGGAAIAARAASGPTLNELMGLGPAHWSALRGALAGALLEGSPLQARLRGCLTPQHDAQYALPAVIGDYTDFYSSIHHATTVGRLFRPDNPLLPNYKWVPVGYHGRSSSIVMSGTEIRRPQGQRASSAGAPPTLGPTRRLDYEVELGVFIGSGNPPGSCVTMEEAESHIFGVCLLNDWSARDLQAWEYQPLGPFLAKNFATSISPWVVPLQALAPYRRAFVRPPSDPQPLPYLTSDWNRRAGSFDIRLETFLDSQAMRLRGDAAHRVSSTSFRHSYWTIAQLVAHHTVNGCNLRTGDLLGTGTQSGPTPGEAGSLLELSAGGAQPIAIGQDEYRTFLEDGDEVSITGWCAAPGQARIGLGCVSGRVLPATAPL
jgi:fumarylacetoacetase